MNAETPAPHPAAAHRSGLDRRRTIGSILATFGAVLVASSAILANPGTASATSTLIACIDPETSTWEIHNERDNHSLTFTTDRGHSGSLGPLGTTTVVYVGTSLTVYSTLDNGVQRTNRATGDCIPTTGSTTTVPGEDTTTTTVPDEATTTTVPDEETTTTVTQSTLASTTTTVPDEATTTTVSDEGTTTTVVDSGGPTTTAPPAGSTTVATVEIAPPTTRSELSGNAPTTVATQLPRTGSDTTGSLATLGALMMLMGGVLVLRSRRDYDFS